MPLRTKLTIWYTAVLALVLVFFSIGVYGIVTALMVQQVDTRLEQAIDSVPSLAFSRRPQLVESSTGQQVVSFPTLDVFRAQEIYVQVISPTGQLLGVSPNLVNAPFTNQLDPRAFKLMAEAPANQLPRQIVEEVQHDNVPPIRVLTRPLITQDGRLLGMVQVGTSLESVKTAQWFLFLTLLGLSALGIVFSAIIGAMLARRALRPVEQITQTAMAIYRAENLDQRVSTPKSNDEVGHLSQAFNEMLDRLQQLFTAQQRLVADVSHEMRTPLTVIRGNVDLMKVFGCSDAESLDALTRESDRMTRLVNDLLLLSQADSGALTMQFVHMDLAPLISDIHRSGQVLAAGRLTVNTACEEGLSLQADPDRLKQVLLNLLDNAIKHTPDGGTVRVEATRSYNNFIRISVSDTGVGIPEQDLPYVFERFYRVDKSRSRANGGAGLGLSIASSIVQAHNGRVVVSSKPGAGTTFDVYLPAQQPQHHAMNGASNGAPLPAPTLPAKR
jgi:heavy metal sensor kinase